MLYHADPCSKLHFKSDPGKIHTHPEEGHWKFLGGGGLKSQIFLKKSMKLNWIFQRGGERELKPKTFHGRCMDINIFWNNKKKFTVWIVHGAIYVIQGHLFSKFC